jgi:hypothetical protein
MELTLKNQKSNESLTPNTRHSDKRNSDVLSDTDRELLQLVSETYIRIQGGQIKSGRHSS